MNRKTKDVCAFLGQDTELDGKLSFKGTARLDGIYRGEIAAAGSLVIGATAQIESDMRVSSIVVGGSIKGSIQAEAKIEIAASGRVYGDIQAPNIMIHPGAIFQGNCLTFQPPQTNADTSESIKHKGYAPIETIENEN